MYLDTMGGINSEQHSIIDDLLRASSKNKYTPPVSYARLFGQRPKRTNKYAKKSNYAAIGANKPTKKSRYHDYFKQKTPYPWAEKRSMQIKIATETSRFGPKTIEYDRMKVTQKMFIRDTGKGFASKRRDNEYKNSLFDDILNMAMTEKISRKRKRSVDASTVTDDKRIIKRDSNENSDDNDRSSDSNESHKRSPRYYDEKVRQINERASDKIEDRDVPLYQRIWNIIHQIRSDHDGADLEKSSKRARGSERANSETKQRKGQRDVHRSSSSKSKEEKEEDKDHSRSPNRQRGKNNRAKRPEVYRKKVPTSDEENVRSREESTRDSDERVEDLTDETGSVSNEDRSSEMENLHAPERSVTNSADRTAENKNDEHESRTTTPVTDDEIEERYRVDDNSQNSRESERNGDESATNDSNTVLHRNIENAFNGRHVDADEDFSSASTNSRKVKRNNADANDEKDIYEDHRKLRELIDSAGMFGKRRAKRGSRKISKASAGSEKVSEGKKQASDSFYRHPRLSYEDQSGESRRIDRGESSDNTEPGSRGENDTALYKRIWNIINGTQRDYKTVGGPFERSSKQSYASLLDNSNNSAAASEVDDLNVPPPLSRYVTTVVKPDDAEGRARHEDSPRSEKLASQTRVSTVSRPKPAVAARSGTFIGLQDHQKGVKDRAQLGYPSDIPPYNPDNIPYVEVADYADQRNESLDKRDDDKDRIVVDEDSDVIDPGTLVDEEKAISKSAKIAESKSGGLVDSRGRDKDGKLAGAAVSDGFADRYTKTLAKPFAERTTSTDDDKEDDKVETEEGEKGSKGQSEAQKTEEPASFEPTPFDINEYKKPFHLDEFFKDIPIFSTEASNRQADVESGYLPAYKRSNFEQPDGSKSTLKTKPTDHPYSAYETKPSDDFKYKFSGTFAPNGFEKSGDSSRTDSKAETGSANGFRDKFASYSPENESEERSEAARDGPVRGVDSKDEFPSGRSVDGSRGNERKESRSSAEAKDHGVDEEEPFGAVFGQVAEVVRSHGENEETGWNDETGRIDENGENSKTGLSKIGQNGRNGRNGRNGQNERNSGNDQNGRNDQNGQNGEDEFLARYFTDEIARKLKDSTDEGAEKREKIKAGETREATYKTLSAILDKKDHFSRLDDEVDKRIRDGGEPPVNYKKYWSLQYKIPGWQPDAAAKEEAKSDQ